MKRPLIAFASALVLFAGAATISAQSRSALIVDPSDMKDGEKKSFTDDGRTVIVERQGNRTHVTIEGADKTERLTIEREGGRVTIGRSGSDGVRKFVVGPDRKRVVIDGIPITEFDTLPHIKPLRPFKLQTTFVCPKDQTTLRVPEANEDATFQCPLDGTVMEKRKSRGFTFYFDDDVVESTAL